MKRIFLIYIIACWPGVAVCQLDSINPTVIQQPGNIYLQHTDVYYAPFAPPDSTHDTRENLCNQSDQLRDSNGVGNQYRLYIPMVYDSAAFGFDTLWSWAPHGTPLGLYAVWQRLFQARTKPDGSTSDIIVGRAITPLHDSGYVIISKNEDVDFRASGGVRMESGFHVMPGAFFHAYSEPKWGDTVFSDEFDDTAKFRNQWHVTNGWGDYYTQGAECSTDSNVRLWPDPDAHDGKALDIVIREDTVDSCYCIILGGKPIDSCKSIIPDGIVYTKKFIFSSAILRSCPFPDSSKMDTPFVAAYAHAPYGKYEFRDKVPHTIHHSLDWGGGYATEYDLNEMPNEPLMNNIRPAFSHQFRFGPCKGRFGRLHGGDTVIFMSSQAEWCLSNNPSGILIDNFPYPVQRILGYGMDTVMVLALNTEWKLPWANSTDTVTFDYMLSTIWVADSLPWKVTKASDGKWRIFDAAYHVNSHHDSLRFSKAFQPVKITLPGYDSTGLVYKSHNCHWEYTLNNPVDKGLLWLDDPIDTTTDSVSGTYAYPFEASDIYKGHYGYPVPYLPFDAKDTTAGTYKYHTFAMEFLPHEVRYLVDSVVVRRFPDRLIPPGSPYYDWVSKTPRSPLCLRPAETDIDWNGGPNSTMLDSLGTNDTIANIDHGDTAYKSATYASRHYFETHPHNPGFWDVGGKPAAHHLLDYVKVWDVPADMKISGYPQ